VKDEGHRMPINTRKCRISDTKLYLRLTAH